MLKVWKRASREGLVGGESSYGGRGEKCSYGVQSCEGFGFRLHPGQRLCATTVPPVTGVRNLQNSGPNPCPTGGFPASGGHQGGQNSPQGLIVKGRSG